MTYEEFKEKYPIGSTIKTTIDTGKVIDYNGAFEYVLVDWRQSTSYVWNSFGYLMSVLIVEDEKPYSTDYEAEWINLCPRCKDVEMGKKLTKEYGLIDKCPNCGYC